MGTEFGIQADVNGSSELHVIKGKVQFLPVPRGIHKLSQMIMENKAVGMTSIEMSFNSIPIQKMCLFVRSILR